MWGRAYKISQTALDELEAAGLDPALLVALRNHKRDGALGSKSFNELLERLGPKKIDNGERKLIRRITQMSLLRLERFIPHRSTREWVDALVFAVAIALVVRTFLFAPFKIPSGSMLPTIQVGDNIFATMFSYGIPVPFTDIKLVRQEIERGDIVIFPYPEDPSVDYIKRVVGKGGETLEIRGERVYINGKPLDEPYAYYEPRIVQARKNNGEAPAVFGPVKVPKGHLFVMGDNRFNSSDSRYWGFVNEKTVKGKGWIVYFSHDPEKSLISGYRLGRIGSILQ